MGCEDGTVRLLEITNDGLTYRKSLQQQQGIHVPSVDKWVLFWSFSFFFIFYQCLSYFNMKLLFWVLWLDDLTIQYTCKKCLTLAITKDAKFTETCSTKTLAEFFNKYVLHSVNKPPGRITNYWLNVIDWLTEWIWKCKLTWQFSIAHQC